MNSKENNTALEMEELKKKADVAQNKRDDLRKQKEFISNNHELKMNELKVSYYQTNTTLEVISVENRLVDRISTE